MRNDGIRELRSVTTFVEYVLLYTRQTQIISPPPRFVDRYRSNFLFEPYVNIDDERW
jgi:hypothetical protein